MRKAPAFKKQMNQTILRTGKFLALIKGDHWEYACRRSFALERVGLPRHSSRMAQLFILSVCAVA